MAIISLVITVPGFLILFVSGFMALGVVTFVLALGVGFFYWWSEQPPFTIKEVEKTLVFQDPQGHRAKVSRTQTARANQTGITEIWVGNIRTDGSIENVHVDGQPPDDDEIRVGVRRICKRYPRGQQRGQDYRMTISFDAIDSFANSTEVYEHLVTTKTKKLKMRINFHPDRPCGAVKAYLQYGGQTHQPLKDPWVSDDRTEVLFEMSKPKEGSEYALEWTW